MKNVFGLIVLMVAFPAFASAPAEAGSGAIAQGLMLAVFVAVFYFLILRPQSKRAKEHQQLVGGLQKGDEVITNGGVLGRVKEMTESFLVIVIAEGVEIFIQRQAIAASVPKGTMKSLA